MRCRSPRSTCEARRKRSRSGSHRKAMRRTCSRPRAGRRRCIACASASSPRAAKRIPLPRASSGKSSSIPGSRADRATSRTCLINPNNHETTKPRKHETTKKKTFRLFRVFAFSCFRVLVGTPFVRWLLESAKSKYDPNLVAQLGTDAQKHSRQRRRRSTSPSRRSLRRRPSPQRLEAELHLPRRVALSADDPERARRDADVRRGELHAIERVEHFDARLEPCPPRQREMLEQRQIDVADAVGAQEREGRACVPERKPRRLAER